MKRTRTFRGALSLLVVGALLCALSVSVFAASSVNLSEKGSISITLDGESDGTLTLYQVASVTRLSGGLAYEFTDAFADSHVSLQDLDNSDLAEYFSMYAASSGIAAVDSTEIAEDGTVRFEDLELGLYLIVQSGASTGYTDIRPFLVSVPLEEDGEWFYDVEATPKVETGISTEPGPNDEPSPSEEPEPSPSEEPSPGESPSPSEEPSPSESPSPSETVTPSPSPSDEPESDDTDETDEPDDSTEDEPEETPGTAVVPDGGSSGSSGGGGTPAENLPQTGQLNWPIPVLAGLGMLLILTGGVIMLTGRKKKTAG